MFRYVALLWDAASRERTATACELERRIRRTAPSWVSLFSAEGIEVLVADASPHWRANPLARGLGVVLGEIYERRTELEDDQPARPARFDERQTRELLQSQGRRLACDYWGNFVALLVDPQAGMKWVVKDPTGSLPCHFTQCSGLQIVFSCLADCLDFRAMRFHVNWAFVRSRIVNGIYEVETCPVAEVSTVHRGECVRFDRRGWCVSRSSYWHPAKHGERDQLIEDPGVAARAIRATVRSSVHTLAASHARVLQQTSGGLDSSIVLGCLRDAPNNPEVTCYTDFLPGSPCDERRWARYATARSGSRHVEVCCETERLNLSQLPELAPSVYPASSFSHWHRGPIERRLAAEHGASATFTGDGGDAGFCSTSYVLAVDHSLRRHGFGIKTMRTAMLVAARRDRTVWSVMGGALRRRAIGSRMRDQRRLISGALQLVRAEVIEAARALDHFPNPWFSSDKRVDLESIWRLGMLAYAPDFYDLSTSHRAPAPSVMSPLCAQPVVEVCRRIPVDVHFDGGRIRGLARRAFAEMVPAAILRRQWKDRPLSQPAAMVNANLEFIRDALLDGALTREGILDRAALERALGEGPVKSGAVSGEVLSHLDLELWIRRLKN